MAAEEAVLRTMLFDFYGELLTEKQREYFDLHYNEDLSLGEIAENNGITRQGVRDVIVRAEAILSDLEDKTGLIKRFLAMGKELAVLEQDAQAMLKRAEQYEDAELEQLAQRIADSAHKLRQE